jgi:hypothetical protein
MVTMLRPRSRARWCAMLASYAFTTSCSGTSAIRTKHSLTLREPHRSAHPRKSSASPAPMPVLAVYCVRQIADMGWSARLVLAQSVESRGSWMKMASGSVVVSVGSIGHGLSATLQPLAASAWKLAMACRAQVVPDLEDLLGPTREVADCWNAGIDFLPAVLPSGELCDEPG